MSRKYPCSVCGGEGRLEWSGESRECHACGGEGEVERPIRKRLTMLKEVGRTGTHRVMTYWGTCDNCGMVMEGPAHQWTVKVDRAEGRQWREAVCIQEGCGCTVEGHAGPAPDELRNEGTGRNEPDNGWGEDE